MMCQKIEDHQIDAIECDDNTFQECCNNVKEIKFCKNIKIHHNMIQKYDTEKKYDVIISNPPFFSNGFLETPEIKSKTKALHTFTLDHDDLIESILRLISKDGIFIVLFPEFEMLNFEKEIGKKGMFPFIKLIMKNKKDDKILRIAQGFSFEFKKDIKIKEIIIRDENNEYTKDYYEMTKDYYKPENFKKKFDIKN